MDKPRSCRHTALTAVCEGCRHRAYSIRSRNQFMSWAWNSIDWAGIPTQRAFHTWSVKISR